MTLDQVVNALPGTNAVAYFAAAFVRMKKGFLTKTTFSAFTPFIKEWLDLNPRSQGQ